LPAQSIVDTMSGDPFKHVHEAKAASKRMRS